MQTLHPSFRSDGNPVGQRKELSKRWCGHWSHSHTGMRRWTTITCKLTKSEQLLIKENAAASQANGEGLDAGSKAEPTHGRQPTPRAIKGSRRAPAADKEIEQRQDAAGAAEGGDDIKRKPHPFKGRKRPPEVGAKIAATKAAFSPERRQEISQKMSKGMLNNPKSNPFIGRKRPPEVGAKVAATRAAFSPERKQEIGRKISEARLKNPRPSPLKGRKRAPEVSAKIAATRAAFSLEKRQEISRNLSEGMLKNPRPSPWEGRKRPPEVGAKIAATKAAFSLEKRQEISQKLRKAWLTNPRAMTIAQRTALSQARLGRKYSQQSIEKMSISQTKRWERQKAMKKQAMQQDSEAGLEEGEESMGNSTTQQSGSREPLQQGS